MCIGRIGGSGERWSMAGGIACLVGMAMKAVGGHVTMLYH